MHKLAIHYDNEKGEKITRNYKLVSDFVAEMESDNIDIPMFDYENVDVEFYGSDLEKKHFETIFSLYDFCCKKKLTKKEKKIWEEKQ